MAGNIAKKNKTASNMSICNSRAWRKNNPQQISSYSHLRFWLDINN